MPYTSQPPTQDEWVAAIAHHAGTAFQCCTALRRVTTEAEDFAVNSVLASTVNLMRDALQHIVAELGQSACAQHLCRSWGDEPTIPAPLDAALLRTREEQIADCEAAAQLISTKCEALKTDGFRSEGAAHLAGHVRELDDATRLLMHLPLPLLTEVDSANDAAAAQGTGDLEDRDGGQGVEDIERMRA